MKLILFILLFPCLVFSKTIKVAIIDSGLDQLQGVKLCKNGMQDFTSSRSMKSEHGGHGNNVTHIIGDGLEKEDYCIYHLKAFSDTKALTLNALVFAIMNKVDIINYSAGSGSDDIWEKALFALALHNKIIINVAAGNEHTNLDLNCNFYPACFFFSEKNFNVIGNLNNKISNYGKIVITRWFDGNDIDKGGVTLSGTSQATALMTREALIKLLKENKK